MKIYEEIEYILDEDYYIREKHLHRSIVNEYLRFEEFQFEEYKEIISNIIENNIFISLKDVLINELEKYENINKNSETRTSETIEYKKFIFSRMNFYNIRKNMKDWKICCNIDDIPYVRFTDQVVK